ncbi:E3 ubiquitin-protein ligase ATL4, partial [Camellia lanceoleosa]
NNLNDSSPPSSSSSPSSSLIIVIIIIAFSIIVTVSLYLLIRFIIRHCNNRSFTAVDDVFSTRNNRDDSNRDRRDDSNHDRCLYEQRNSSNDLINSLPLFTFGSITGNIVNGDCAVCLSRFERNDQLRLLPLCCHAFHTDCIDASNQASPLCRSVVYPAKEDILNKIISSTVPEDRGNKFQIDIESVRPRRGRLDSNNGRRSYSICSFDYIVSKCDEVSLDSTHRRGLSNCTLVSKDSFFTGSSRQSNMLVAIDEKLEANRIREDISELFQWFSRV